MNVTTKATSETEEAVERWRFYWPSWREEWHKAVIQAISEKVEMERAA